MRNPRADYATDYYDKVDGTGRLLHTLQAHRALAMAVAFSPYGRHLASGGGDSLVRIWNVETGELISTLKGH